MTSTPSNKRERIVILNRWADEFAAYDRYIDHRAHDVAYVCTPEGAAALSASRIVHAEHLPDFKNEAALSEAVRRCADRLGGLERLIALSEFDLIAAARLREVFDIAGDRPETVRRFRDKTVMKQAIIAAGLKAPRFVELNRVQSHDAEELANLRLPLIIKPRAGAASDGVVRIDTRARLAELWPGLAREDYECEEFVEGPIYHVDGLVSDGAFVIVRGSRYVNTCLDFANGKPLGSIMLNAGSACDELLVFAKACLDALALKDGAFHLEVIQGSTGFCFLEVGARVGGGEIPFMFRDLYGVDLYQLWVAQQSGDAENFETLARKARAAQASPLRGGFLMLPEPVGTRLIDVRLPTGIAQLYGAIVPKLNHVFNGTGGYDQILARFRYRGDSEAEIAAAIDVTLGAFHYTLSDIAAPGPSVLPRVGDSVAMSSTI
ncbi:ATP-grasp domain-containing protein [Paraburkholderia solisilvae]|uniref:ATP-grasp domain-containing protein n=1 Tax=Paraburkholderia solisilvae TaxID=624376 RepID=A0A6J5DEG7_9BURK|nr:biotin carboxylase [Paraburkholderia solisilvae]CAB3751834.1 hypothetical protein LMG29739_01393 [Paraburkholderia solisilvae]